MLGIEGRYKVTLTLTIDIKKELNIGKNKAYELINTGKIKSIMIGRKIGYFILSLFLCKQYKDYLNNK